MIVVVKEAVKNMESAAEESGISMEKLMENAGTKVAALAARLLAEKKLKKVCVICGSGNNGGDGFVLARMLSVMSEVTVIMVCGEPQSQLARMNFGLLPENIEVYYYNSRLYECIGIIKEAEMIIDAVYGIGFHGMLDPDLTDIVSFCNENQSAVKIAVDIPTGAVCDTGEIGGNCFRSDYTMTFTTMKPAHVLYPAAEYCGEVIVEGVGIPETVKSRTPYVMKTTDQFIDENPLPQGSKFDHKGSKGTLVSVCGSRGMAGAALIAGEAALRTGVGLLKMAVPKSIYGIAASTLREPVFCVMKENFQGRTDSCEAEKLLELINQSSAGLIGCGMGIDDDTRAITCLIAENSEKPLVIDADGIKALTVNIDVLNNIKAPIILTPHPGEMAELVYMDTAAVQADRFRLAVRFAIEHGVTVVLKGAYTIIAVPEGRAYVNLTCNDGMAKGGSGDMLAGMMASFLAQGISPEAAAVYAVYYHSKAGDACAEKYSRRSMLPTDMIAELKNIF